MKGIEGSKLGRYELRCRVAQGGMSEVYLGYDYRVRRWVAVKVLYGSDEPFVRRFEREALAIGALSHEHILPLYDFGEQRPWYYLVMPYVEGGTLRDYLLKRERLPLDEAGSFLEQIASALQHAHDHGVVHRDVKPSNILLRPDGHAYLADFGLAKAKMESGSFSHTGAMVGTPEYMAPEQSNGITDYRSDIYSLGIILYQMLTGNVPFSGDSPVAVSIKHIQTPPPSPMQLNSAIPQTVEEVILKALAKNPDDRFQQAQALANAYREALQKTLPDEEQQAALPVPTAAALAGNSQDAGAHIATEVHPVHPRPLTKTRLYPIGYESSLLPSVSGVYNKRRRTHRLRVGLLCLVALIVLVTASMLWHNSNTSRNQTPRSTPASIIQYNATGTALEQARKQAILAAEARVQATAGVTTALGTGKVLYYNDMTSKSIGWIDDGDQCYFSAQGYHVYTNFAHTLAWCYSNQLLFANAIMTVQVQLLQGDFCGFVFRLTPQNKTFYVLEVNSHGAYRMQRAQGSNPNRWLTLIDWTFSPIIHAGYGQTNTILVVATGAQFRLYINQQLLAPTFTDTMYTTAYARGMLGLLVGEDTNHGTAAIFSHIGVFQQ